MVYSVVAELEDEVDVPFSVVPVVGVGLGDEEGDELKTELLVGEMGEDVEELEVEDVLVECGAFGLQDVEEALVGGGDVGAGLHDVAVEARDLAGGVSGGRSKRTLRL